MAKITIIPNIGKGSDTGGIDVVWETVPNVGDTLSWQFQGRERIRIGRGIVQSREFKANGDVILRVSKTGGIL